MFWTFKKKVITDSVGEVRPPSTLTFKHNLDEPDEPEIILSDEDRVTNYFASGGEVVDLSNKTRAMNDGFESDQSLIKPWNQAHTGTKKGLSDLMRGKR